MLARFIRAAFFPAVSAALLSVVPSDADAAISYYEEIRPILQAHCQGCHQPAKAGTAGEYVMTSFDLV